MDLGEFPLAAEQRPRRHREVRSSERSEGREIEASELVDALSGEKVLKAVLAEVAKIEVYQRGRGLRHKHLSAMTRRRNTRGAMNVDAHVALLRDDRHSPCAGRRAPAPDRPRVASVSSAAAARAGGRGGEGKEERVALCIDLDAVMPSASLAYDSSVPRKRLAVRLVSELVQKPR